MMLGNNRQKLYSVGVNDSRSMKKKGKREEKERGLYRGRAPGRQIPRGPA